MDELLRTWFASNGRALPWRHTRDPYAILVSEVMLQQTQVERVVPRWHAWLERWPTAAALAAAAPADVIREWQGLGYNRRALNLHRAARAIAADGWPDDLTELAGVGPYTAAAIRNQAFGEAVLPVDTNVRRIQERTGHPFGPEALQALFDLGATICLARVPRCGDLPAGRRAARRAGCASSRCASSPASRARSASAAQRCLRRVAEEAAAARRPRSRGRRLARAGRPRRRPGCGPRRAPDLEPVVHPDVGLDVDAPFRSRSISTGTSAPGNDVLAVSGKAIPVQLLPVGDRRRDPHRAGRDARSARRRRARVRGATDRSA